MQSDKNARPKDVILKILLATEGRAQTSQTLVSACALLGATDNSARTALTRLREAGLVEAIGRGEYRLGQAARPLAADVARWRSGEARVRAWAGGWIVVHTGALPRSDRAALRVRERALNLLGLRELEPGLAIRPDNLADDLSAIRRRLYGLGLDPAAAVFSTDNLDDARVAAAPQLWTPRRLEARYREQIDRLQTWSATRHRLDHDQAARESYWLGDRAIRELVFDPLLPGAMIDTQLRSDFTDLALRFDRLGQTIWQLRAPHADAAIAS